MEESGRPVRLGALPLACFVLAVAAELGAVTLSWGLEPWTDTLAYAAFSTTLAGAGTIVASRHARNPIGWLMLWVGVSNAVLADLAQGYGLRAAQRGWPQGTLAEWCASASVVVQIAPMVFLWVLFPTGRLLSRRWAVVPMAGVVASTVAIGGYVLSHRSDSDYASGVNPYVAEHVPTSAMWAIGNLFLLGALVGSAAAVVVRLHASRGVERQQLKLFAFAAVVAVVVLPVAPFVWEHYPAARAVVAVVLLAQPVAVCVAMFRYRLYDIDRVISRTISYSLLTAMLLAVYAVTVVTLGAVVGRSSTWVAAAATLVAVTAFRPARDRVQSLVDRRFDRARYDALARVDRFTEDLRAGRGEPEQVAALLREVTGDPLLAIHHRPHGEREGPTPGIPVRRGDSVVATVTGGPVLAERASLVGEALDRAGLAIEIAGLRSELRRQLDEVEASRARLVAVADEERRRLERDLHDGAQQRLVSIGLALRHAQHELGVDHATEASRTLDGAVAEIAVAIDELRELAHGLRPSTLDAGLGPALRELALRAPLAVSVDITAERFTRDAETTAYFFACEALTNAVKHARASHVALGAVQRNGVLVVEVADDGVGGASPGEGSGLRGLADRLAARGGTLTISSATTGTTITASIPCAS